MGLLKAGIGAIGGVLADQWKEHFYCESMPDHVLMTKGQKQTSDRSSNTKGEENVISNGSVISVNEGQCMLIVEQGKVVEFSAEPGQFVWDTSSEPSLFSGKFGESLKESFKAVGSRFAFGGSAGKDQRVYFINTKEIGGNKYGTANPVPFRVVDTNIGLDMDINIKCFGSYSYSITDPLVFYSRVAGNVAQNFTRDMIDSRLKTDLLTALQPAFGKISAMGIRYSSITLHTQEIADALNEQLSQKWAGQRGISVVAFGIDSMTADEEDEKTIKELQRTAVYRNPNMAAAQLVGAQSDAMRAAAANENAGPMFAFAGMNMAAQAGGMNAQNLFQMGQQQPMQAAPAAPAGWTCACGAAGNTGKFCAQCGAKKPEPKPQAPAGAWKCPGCGAEGNTGKFCAECGTPKPAAPEGWVCSCGAVNKGKFCPECGAKKPAGVPQYKCDKCGWEPEDKAHPPKFCPECGDPFDDGDVQ